MSDVYTALSQIGQLRDQVHALEQAQHVLQGQIAELGQRERTLEATITALIEILVDAQQLEPQELKARVDAATIARRHAAREASETSQAVWESAGPGTKK